MTIVKRRRAAAGLLVALSGCADPSYGGLAGPTDASAPAAPTTVVGDGGRSGTSGKADAMSDTMTSTSGARDAASDPGPALVNGDVAPSGAPSGADAAATVATLPTDPPILADAGANTANASTLPTWAAQLPGVYAVRVQAFSVSSGTALRWTSLGKMNITQTGDQLSAVMLACSMTAATQAGTDLGRTDGAAKLPARPFAVTFKGDTFTISPTETAVGYDEKPPEACQGHEGGSVTKRPFQTWIAGTQCVCGIEALPEANDCRVTDPDSDGRPGYSSSSPIAGVTTWGVSQSFSKFVEGHVGNEQAHTALYFEDGRLNQFGCDPIGACGAVGTSKGCPLQDARVLFAPLHDNAAPSGGWTCASIEASLSKLFPGAPPPFPADCTP